jgi:hypothetical protein
LATIQHPASLNALHKYRQACSIYRHTSRAKNAAWYQSALDLNLQLHIRPDGPSVFTAYFDRKTSQWSPGPTLNEEILHDAALFEPIMDGIIKYARSVSASSLGIILHVADEFATTELKAELDNPAALPELRNLAINDPASIVEDSSILADQASWRVIPYFAAGSSVIGTTITLTRQFAPLFENIRKAAETANFPVVTHALSSPLVSIIGLPKMLTPNSGKPFVVILQYSWFTALAFFNEHADLKLIRTLQHRGIRRATNFHNALSTTSASLEFLDPDLFILPLGQEIDRTLETNLRANFGNCKVEVLQAPKADGVPEYCPDLVIAATPSANDPARDLTSHTFTVLREETWALQDFLPPARETVEIYPRKSEMNILRLVRLARVAMVIIALGGLGYFGYGAFKLTQNSIWQFDPNQANTLKTRLDILNKERQTGEHWNNLLDDRSKTWVTMESIARMFSDKSGVLIKGCSYSAKPDSAAGQTKAGFVKTWKINGYARDEALEYLNTLNTRDGINAHFNEIAKITGNKAYSTAIGNRNISVNVRTQENNAFKPNNFEEPNVSDENSYPFSFELTFTQRFEATDPMAIYVPKAP